MENLDDKIVFKTVDEETKIVKHLVIAGGGATGFSFYGMLRETNTQGLWKIENIESIYATSVGAIIAVSTCLKYDWKTLDDFFILRPWQHVYKFNMFSILDAYKKRGFYDIKSMEETILPLFKGKDISIDVTMKEFYELTNIELHFFATEINSFELIDLSYLTHPEWRLIDAVYCSACLPIMYSPFLKDSKYYCDGGILLNYPLEPIISKGIDPSHILGISRMLKKKNNENETLTDVSSLLDYFIILLNRFSKNLFLLSDSIKIPNEFKIEADAPSLINLYSVLNDEQERRNLIDMGVEIVKETIDTLYKK